MASLRRDCEEFEVVPSTRVADSGGGFVAFTVESRPGCLWTTQSEADFLELDDSIGSGKATVAVRVQATDADERSGELTIAGRTVTVRQVREPDGVCGRTSQVADAIARSTGVECGHLSNEHLRTIRTLNLAGTGLVGLSPGDFEGMSRLHQLWLSRNRLKTLSADWFRGLSALEELILAETALTDVASGAFGELSALSRLDLSRNALVALPEDAFAGPTRLRELRLEDNGLRTVADNAFAGLTALRKLDLARNRIAAVGSATFSGLEALEELLLQDNEIAMLPARAFAGLRSLRLLNLEDNRIATVDAQSLTGLTRLERLKLNSNRLSALSPGVFDDLGSLDKLNLGSNELTSMPADLFGNLPSLKWLDLGINSLRELPIGGFESLSSLETLFVQGNGLEDVPSGARWYGATVRRGASPVIDGGCSRVGALVPSRMASRGRSRLATRPRAPRRAASRAGPMASRRRSPTTHSGAPRTWRSSRRRRKPMSAALTRAKVRFQLFRNCCRSAHLRRPNCAAYCVGVCAGETSNAPVTARRCVGIPASGGRAGPCRRASFPGIDGVPRGSDGQESPPTPGGC